MSAIERILVIRLGALGDLVLCFQAFQDIRTAHPNAEIALLTTAPFVAFARTMPWFNHVIVDERPSFLQIDAWKNLRREIQAFAPTSVYDLQGKFRQTILYFLLGGPHLKWSGAAPLCTHPRLWPPSPGMHFTDFLAAQLRLADVPESSPVDLTWLDAPLDDFTLPPRFAVLIPGCAKGRGYKRWPASHYAQVTQKLRTKGIESVAIGTNADKDAIAAIRVIDPAVGDFSGKTSFAQLAALTRQAVCVVGNDTGPVHLAAAIGAPTLALMSEHVNPLWSAPKGPKAKWLQGKPLSSLTADEVLLALTAMLDKTA